MDVDGLQCRCYRRLAPTLAPCTSVTPVAQHNEIEFEREFAEYLAAHGWLYSMNDTGYDKERALFPPTCSAGCDTTQPEQVDKVINRGPGRRQAGTPAAGPAREGLICRWPTAAAP